MGNFSGTVGAPIVVTSGKGSNAASKKIGCETSGSGDAKVINKEAVKVSIERVKLILELEMYKHRWRITQIKRAQSKLSEENDRLWLHGYIVLKLVNDEHTKFCRIDWGSDGLHHEIECEESKLTENAEHLQSLAESQIGNQSTRTEMLFEEVAGAVKAIKAGELPTVRGAEAVYATAGWAWGLPIAAAVVSGIADPVIAEMNKSYYEDVPLPESALGRLVKHLEKEMKAPRLYDLGFHNCNHFANELRALLLESNI